MRDRLYRLLPLGLAAGALEFALRTSPSLGLSLAEQLTFLTLACAAGAIAPLPGVLSRQRPVGAGLGLLVALHVTVGWRTGVGVNLSLREPQVIGTLVALVLGSLAAGIALNRVVEKVEKLFYPMAGGAALLGLLLGRPLAPLPAEGPNLVLVSLDTTRADRLGPYGGPAQTPNLQRLSDEGVLFEQAIATAPLTEPSHLSILTGLRTTTTGVVANGTPLGEQPDLLSHRLKEEGLRTGAVVSGFPLHSHWGWEQGFDVFDDDFGRLAGMHQLSLVQAIDQVLLRTNLREREGEGVLRRGRTFLDRNRRGRFFLWAHFFDPHAPYERFDVASAPRDGEALDLPDWWPQAHRGVTDPDWLVRAYDAEIEYVDALLGELLDELPPNTLVVVVADHGESLTEHGYLFEHGDELYDPSLRVPLLLWWPEGLEPGVVPCQVSTVDIAPTIEELLGLPPVASDGRSLVGLQEGCEDVPAIATTLGARHVEEPPLHTALRTPELKLLDRAGVLSLFDLVSDPGELRPVEDAERQDRALELLDATITGRAPLQAQDLDNPEVMETLRALGYME